jgi:hypothetical protein
MHFLQSAKYNEETKDLTVYFSTSVHTYHKVPKTVGRFFENLADPYERIEFFDRRVEGKFRSSRGEPE